MAQRVTIVGMGMTPDDLTPRQRERIAGAEVLVGGRRHLAHFEDHAAERLEIGSGLEALVETIARRSVAGKRVVVIASGDPLYHGIGRLLIDRLGSDRVRVDPNVTAVGAAFARLGRPWNDVPVVSCHARDGLYRLLGVLSREPTAAVLTDPRHDPARIAREIWDRGMHEAVVWVLERLGAPDERVRRLDLEAAAGADFAGPNLMVVEQPPWEAAGFGLPDAAIAHEAGLITKAEVRAASLARLRIRPSHTVWDLGAGSGSVALEAAALAWQGRVVAVEKDPRRAETIRRNRTRLHRWHVDVVETRLPTGMEDLPDPDRVFVGGGGRDLAQIIEKAVGRLPAEGVMVVNTVLLESLQTARETLGRLGMAVDVVQVQVSRGRETAGDQRLAAENPVWVVSGERSGKAKDF